MVYTESVNVIEYDTETGFYHLQSREYDPQTGRFINADSQLNDDILGNNLFAYCENNPVMYTDPTGHSLLAIIGLGFLFVGMVVGLTSDAPANNSKNSNIQQSANSLPKEGKPGSSQTLPNPDGTPKQKRWYGPDGNAERDRDYNHGGDVPFPHDHEWKDGVRQPKHLPPDPSYNLSWEPVLGVGLVIVSVAGILWVAANDCTGVGTVDDFLFGPLSGGVGQGVIMIFGE